MIKKIIYILIPVIISLLFVSCNGNGKSATPGEAAATNHSKDVAIQEYNLEQMKKRTQTRTPYDTISVLEYVLKTFPHGTYVADFDRTFMYNVPRPALIYIKRTDTTFIYAVIVRSMPGQRLIEPKNVIGYNQSFVNLDSTKLGTAFFYLELFKGFNNSISVAWEVPIPSHGGFNDMIMRNWKFGIPYIKVDFHDAIMQGHVDYNYFFIDGYSNKPHLLMTYKGLEAERSLANINNDKYPDYYEHVFIVTPTRIYSPDSVGFIWNTRRNLYVNTRNYRQTRQY
jgi:hypothetical protein